MVKQLGIIIPVYNEQESIAATLLEIEAKVKTPSSVYVIYDSESDNSLPAVKNAMQRNKELRLVKNLHGNGFINAIKTGLEIAQEDVVLVVMADGSDDPSCADRMFALIAQGFDIVCGSRYVKGGRQVGGPLFKKTLSRMAGVTLYYLVGLPTHDVTNSYKMYRKKCLIGISIESNGGFELGMELVIKAFINGSKIAEVPCTWRNNCHKKSRFQLIKWLPRYLYWYWFAIRNRFVRGARLTGG